MTETKAIFSIIVGCVVVVLTFTVKQWYYARGLMGVSISDRPMPRWLSRLLGLFVGGLFILVGISFFLHDR